ncbi:MAG: TonB-dependent receptor [Maribacter sp.]|nr:TonB-dependent receptor [Maribacter sp.]
MKHIFIFLFIAMTINYGFAQNKITGTISNAENGTPLPEVSVYFPELEKGTATNSEGKFEISEIPSGSFEMVISSMGFRTFEKKVTIAPGTNTLEFQLTPTAIEMEEVIVSTPFHKLQSENVMKVERASMKELKTNGALTLTEGISSLAGVESVSTGVGIGKPVIRGLSSNRVLVYAQGVRLENQQYGAEHGLGINDAGVESVEVIKGPASLLYGSDAMGGVLYFNPEKFAESNSTEGDVNLNYFTNTQGLGANAGIRTSGEKIKFLLRGSHVSHIDYKTGNNERLTNSRFNEYDLKTGLGYQSNTMKTELRYNFNSSELGIPEEIGEQTRERSPVLPYQQIDNHILSSKTGIYFKNSSLNFSLGYIMNIRKEFEDHEHEEEEPVTEEHEEEGPALHMNLSTFSYNVEYHLPEWGSLETIVGVQGMHQNNENFGEEVLIPNATTDDIGFLATSHVHFANESGLQLGLRYDHRNIRSKESLEILPGILDRSFNSFNVALGYKLELLKKLTARINLATGFRAPNLAELTSDGTHEGTNRYEIGNPDLTQEKNFQTDLSLEYNNKHIEFFVNGFYNSINDYIFIQPNGEVIDEVDVFVYTQENANLFGGEIGFHLHPHPLDWLHYESSFETVIGKRSNDQYLPLIPANKLTNTIRVEGNNKSDWLEAEYAFVALRSVFDQSKVDQFESTTNGYNLVDIGLGGDIKLNKIPIQVRLSANNIFDKAYISHLSRLKTDGIANIGRNISLAVSILL